MQDVCRRSKLEVFGPRSGLNICSPKFLRGLRSAASCAQMPNLRTKQAGEGAGGAPRSCLKSSTPKSRSCVRPAPNE
eukprot:7872110-Alexandrium_andersonii.AAC.1